MICPHCHDSGRPCRACDGEGVLCDVCGESPLACECVEGPTLDVDDEPFWQATGRAM